MKIAIVHTAVSQQSTPDDRDVLDQVDAVSGALNALGHAVSILPCDLDLAAVKSHLVEIEPGAVFNLVESLDGHMRLIHLFPALLDAMGLPYTGSSAEAIWITTHKGMAKEKLAAAGLPTPPWFFEGSNPDAPDIHTDSTGTNPDQKSWIIKSLWEHASVGLDEGRVVSVQSFADLAPRLKEVASQTGSECFAEAFIDGREFNLSILGGPGGPQVLAPAEIVFEGYGSNKPKIVGYKAKWDPDSWEYRHTPRRFDFPESDRPLLEEMEDLTLSCWTLFKLSGYARVDFRVDRIGKPWILEVNTNPCLSSDAGFAAALEKSGISFKLALQRILNDAICR